jgi:hypothetical protein
VSDLRERVPAHSLIEQLLHQWDIGAIHRGEKPDEIVIDEEARSWYQGVIGERRIAGLLAQLGPEWTVLHSVPFGTGSTDIDHIAIGPGGVFTINTKYSPGKDIWSAGVGMYVGGFKQRYVGRSLDESRNASERLSVALGRHVPVFGVVVFVDPGKLDRKAVAGVEGEVIYVLADDELLATLGSGAMFGPTEVNDIVARAVRPETWHRSPKPSRHGDYVAREFDALEAAVGTAIRARRSLPASANGTRPRVPSATPARAPRSRSNYSRPANRSSSRRPAARRGRKKQTSAEKLLGVLFPIAAFIIAAIYLSNLGH